MKIKFFIIFLLFAFACNTKKSDDFDWGAIHYIEIGAKNVSQASLDSLIFLQKYIKLETNERSFLASIDKIELIKNRLYILDKTYTSIKIFNLDGSYYGDVGGFGTGDGKFLNILDFTYDKKRNTVLVLSHIPGIYEYDLDGNFLGKIEMPFAAGNIVIRDSLKYYFLNQLNSKVADHNNLIITDSENNIRRKSFKIPSKLNGSFTFIGGLFKNSKNLYFNPPLSNIIYKINGYDVQPAYKFSFADNNLPKRISKSYKEFLKEGNNYSFLRNSFVKLNNCILFSFVSNRIMQIGAYDIESKSIATSFKHINGNPITKIMGDDFWFVNDSSVISYIPIKGFNSKKEIDINSLDKTLRSIIKASNGGDNPILMIFSVANF